MNNTQVTNYDDIVVQNSSEEFLPEETPLDMVKKMIPLAQKGQEITLGNEKLHSLFLNIHVLTQEKLLHEVEKITDFETENDELLRAGDTLGEIINYSSKGFQLTDLSEGEEKLGKEFSEEHLLFAEILMIADTEIHMHIPTPVEEE